MDRYLRPSIPLQCCLPVPRPSTPPTLPIQFSTSLIQKVLSQDTPKPQLLYPPHKGPFCLTNTKGQLQYWAEEKGWLFNTFKSTEVQFFPQFTSLFCAVTFSLPLVVLECIGENAGCLRVLEKKCYINITTKQQS